MKNQTNTEVKAAIIVAIIMVTAILIAIIFTKEETATNTIDLHVYKLYDVEGSKDQHVYRECSMTTDDLIKLYSEYRKITKLSDTYRRSGETINGDYKIVSGNEFIAFDSPENSENSNKVYRSDNTAIYMYNSNIYKLAEDLCTQSEQNAKAKSDQEKIESEVKK